MKIIDADKLHYIRKWFEDSGKSEVVVFAKEIDKAPTVKAIPIELYEQVKGERDIAIEQLKALNIELFEKPYRKAIPIEYIEAFKKEFRAVASVKAVIEWLLENWEKKNETN